METTMSLYNQQVQIKKLFEEVTAVNQVKTLESYFGNDVLKK